MSAYAQPSELDRKLREIERALKPVEGLQKLLSETYTIYTTTVEGYKDKQAELECQIQSLIREKDEEIDIQSRIKGHKKFFEIIEDFACRSGSAELQEFFRDIHERIKANPNMTLEQLRQSSNIVSS